MNAAKTGRVWKDHPQTFETFDQPRVELEEKSSRRERSCSFVDLCKKLWRRMRESVERMEELYLYFRPKA